MHWAAHGQTAAEVIAARADAGKPNMGLTSWSGLAPKRVACTGRARDAVPHAYGVSRRSRRMRMGRSDQEQPYLFRCTFHALATGSKPTRG